MRSKILKQYKRKVLNYAIHIFDLNGHRFNKLGAHNERVPPYKHGKAKTVLDNMLSIRTFFPNRVRLSTIMSKIINSSKLKLACTSKSALLLVVL